ncbi:hypothetical protein DFH05DRAFT_1487665, partial [Lentinula detonsa]
MILAAFSAFATVAAGTSTAFREPDVRSVGILLYSELILKDESNEIDLAQAGPTFPSLLKVLLDLPLASSPDAQDRYQRLVHKP